LHVCGTKLCNQYDQPIQLRGMSTHGIQWYAHCIKTASLDALAYDWNADILRISLYVQEGGYETDPRKFTDLVHSYIEEATKRGLYALVDWHQLDPRRPELQPVPGQDLLHRDRRTPQGQEEHHLRHRQ
jgi:endoglucanase